MVIVLWVLLRILFLASAVFLIYYLFRLSRHDRSLPVFFAGIKTALKDCGFHFKNRSYSLELYKWAINENEEVCEESLDRASWPAMDIADWMKEGLPRDAEGHSLCGKDCDCKLILYKKEKIRQSNNL